MDHEKAAQLVTELARAKKTELRARERRVEAEVELIKACGFALAEGGMSIPISSSDVSATVRFEQPVRTKIDREGWEKLRRTLPRTHPLREMVRTKYDVDKRVADHIRRSDPESWRAASSCVTRTPGKISVEIKSLVIEAGVRFSAEDERTG